MIPKQTYDIYRKSDELPLFIIYDFYLETKNPQYNIMTIEQFNQFFPEFMKKYNGMELIYSNGTTVLISFSVIAYQVLRYYEELYYPIEEYEVNT